MPLPVITNGQLILRKDEPGLEALIHFFNILLKVDQLLIANAIQENPSDGKQAFSGKADTWDATGVDVRLTYDITSQRLLLLQLNKSLPSFAGIDLKELIPGYAIELDDLTLHLVVEVPNGGDSTIGIVTTELRGTFVLGQQIQLPFRIQHPGSSQRYTLDFDFSEKPPPGIKELAALLGAQENPTTDLQWLPEKLRAKPVSVKDLRLTIDLRDAKKLVNIGVTLAIFEEELWPIIPGVDWLAIGGLSMTLDVDYPLDPAYRFPVFSVTGEIQIGEANTNDGIIAITARWPDFAISGGLIQGSEIKLGQLLHRAGLPVADDALEINKLYFTAEPNSDPKLFSFGIAIRNAWSFRILNDKSLDITGLSLSLNYNSNPAIGLGGQFTGTFNIAGIDVYVQATHRSAGSGWQFKGGTGPGQEIPIGTLIADLEEKMGVSDIPDSVRGLTIENLGIAIDTKAKSFFFTIETKFPVNGQDVVTVLTIDLKRGEKNYSSFFSGRIVINPLEFDLVFSKDKAATIVLAGYQNLAGGRLPIEKLLSAVNAGADAIAAAKDIEIDLKDALFVYDKAAAVVPGGGQPGVNPPASSDGKVLFALDIGGGMNLSNLPLVGKLFPKDQSLRVMVQPVITSADFSQADLGKIKPLIPPGGTTLPAPEGGFTGRLFISGTLEVGAQKFPLGLNISKGPNGTLTGTKNNGSGGGNGNPLTTPPPAAKTDNVKWFNVQKALGPVTFKRVGFQFDSGILWFLLDASLAAGPLNVSLDGLAAGSPLKEFEPHFSLRGLGVDFKQGGVEIGGAFLRRPGKTPDEDEFDGLAIIRTAPFTLSALGSYTRREGHPSMFIYGVLDFPLGGPAFFFITGLAAGFGYNRDLKMPVIEQVAAFPLVAQAVSTPGQTQDLEKVLDSLRIYVPPDIGQIFLCAGIRFSTFEIIDSFALLAVQFGRRFEIDLLGLSTLVLPTPEEGSAVTPLAEVQLALLATFMPGEGFLGIRAQLTNNSFVLSRACHLTGGFAFYCWFKDGYMGGKEGDFVITLGGYHPAYKPPAYYPMVPRLGFNWQVAPELSIKGGLYFALTGNAVMAGGGLQALWNSGPLKAWFLIGADFLIAWKPYHYDARVYLDMGISFTFHLFGTHTITLELGADLHIWGPEFSGIAKIHILIFTVTVKFGDDASPKPDPIDWATFRSSFLPAEDKACSILVQSGLVNKKTSDSNDLGIINPKHFALATNSAIPITAVSWSGSESWKMADPNADMPGNRSINIGSMAITDSAIESQVTITVTYDNVILDGGAERENPFKITPITKNAPAGLWGTDLTPDLNSDAQIGGVITGFTIEPAKAPVPGHTRDIERKNLQFETSQSDKLLGYAAGFPLMAMDMPDARNQIELMINTEGTAQQRSSLLQQWNLREDRDVRLKPDYVHNLMGNPRIIIDL